MRKRRCESHMKLEYYASNAAFVFLAHFDLYFSCMRASRSCHTDGRRKAGLTPLPHHWTYLHGQLPPGVSLVTNISSVLPTMLFLPFSPSVGHLLPANSVVMRDNSPHTPSSSLWPGTLLALFLRKRPRKQEHSLQQQRAPQQPHTMILDDPIDNGTHLLSDDSSTEPPDDDAAASAYDGYVIVQPSGPVSAVAAWKQKFGFQRHVELTKDDKELFIAGRRLGGGGFGEVHETVIKGISVALKRTYVRRLTPRQLNEIKILGRISEKRHRHIVDLVGSYTHQQRKFIEVGLLMWPVAQTDLSELLQNFWVFSRCYSSYLESGATEPDTSLQTAMEPLMALLLPKATISPTSSCAPLTLLEAYKSRLRASIGCIAEAVADLHRQDIRHKDLKPSQILLSPDGLWLTDFGWSMDMTEFPQSATDGGDNITLKYQAPERANKRPCGRPEDIFALGCIFVEIAHTLVSQPSHVNFVRPWLRKGFIFQANLHYRQKWLEPLIYDLPYSMGLRLNNLIEKMLAYAPKDRPRSDTIVKKIKNITNSDYGSPFACPCYFLPQVTANASDRLHEAQ